MFLVPNAILKDMLSAALQVRGALSSSHNAPLKPRLDELLRRIFVTHVLAQTWVVAVGGTQGAGKTTLVCQLYGMDSEHNEWLEANAGQGERMPVLIQESTDVTEPEGWVHKLVPPADEYGAYDVHLESVTASDFRKAARGDDPTSLLPVLKVPARHFQASDAALMLLPGYEQRHQQNAVWQELIKQALSAAGACVIVTDQTRLANSSNQALLKDRELSGIEPVVAITKTEEASEAVREKLCRTVAEQFKQDGWDVSRVICTGRGAAFAESWSRQLVEEIISATNSASRVEGMRVQHLTTLLDDMQKLLADVEEEITTRSDNADDAWEQFIEDHLKPYDKAVDKLHKAYMKQLDIALEAHYDEAWRHLLQAIKPDEGFDGWLASKFRSASEQVMRQRKLIEQAWRAPGDCQECHLQALTYVTFDKLNGSGVSMLPRPTFSPKTPLIARTGYTSVSKDPWSAIQPEAAKNFNILLTLGNEEVVTKTAGKHIVLLPALALEFSRLAQLAAVDCSALRNAPPEGTTVMEGAEQAKTNFLALMSIQNEVTGAITTAFGAKDGTNLRTMIGDVKGKLPKGQDAGRGERLAGNLLLGADIFLGSIGIAVGVGAAVVAVGLLVRAAEKEQLGQAEKVLTALKNAYRDAYSATFKEITDKVRDRMVEVQRERLNLDLGLYERDRLALTARRLQKAVDSLDKALPPLLA